MEHGLQSLITLTGAGAPEEDTLLSLDNAYGEFLTFWSLEETYPQNRLRYHLGQVCMVQVMDLLAESGKTVKAIICDPDSLTMKSETYNLWRGNIAISMRFIDLVTDRSIEVQRMSKLIIEKIRAKEQAFFSLRTMIAEASIHFRDEMLDCSLSSKAESELTRYRGYAPEGEPHQALKPLVSKLTDRFNLPEHLLLPTAYAYINRPSWFFAPWLVDFTAYLASEAMKRSSLVMLEGNRNAYAWLLMQCLFEIARSLANEASFNYKWPTMAFLRSVPSISGDSYMGLTAPGGCLFLDSSTDELKQKVSTLPLWVRREYNSLFLDNQQLFKVDTEGWEDVFLARFATYQSRVSELLKSNKTTSRLRKRDRETATDSPGESTLISPDLQDKIKSQTFDVFLCHNSADKPIVKSIGRQLKERGILPWLDEWELRPGLPWQRILEEQILQIKAAAVFVGQEGIGPWQNEELESFIRQFVQRKCPVIPVLLPNAPSEPKLPVFLANRTYVDFRKDDPDPLQQLIWGITGERAGKIS